MFKITFEFDEKSEKISNLSVHKVADKKPKQEDDSVATLIVDSNKLILNDSLIQTLGAEPTDRISINYYQVDKETTFPLIGKAEFFADKLSGNKLTKSNTVSFKGQQRDILLQYGEKFTIIPFNEGIYKLIHFEEKSSNDNKLSIEDDLKEEIEDFEKLTDDVISSQNEIDDLPF